ncbi:MAG: hypothetical protein ABFD94_12045 [Armatimonadia bacterium]
MTPDEITTDQADETTQPDAATEPEETAPAVAPEAEAPAAAVKTRSSTSNDALRRRIEDLEEAFLAGSVVSDEAMAALGRVRRRAQERLEKAGSGE